MVKRRASEGLTGHRPERRKPGGSWWWVQGGLGSELDPGGLGSLGILSVWGRSARHFGHKEKRVVLVERKLWNLVVTERPT